MKILLDTHMLLWALLDSPELPARARYLIEDANNDIYYSIVSLWEIQIKHLRHPEEMPVDVKEIEFYCEDSGFHNLPIRRVHVERLADILEPLNVKHKDPFDRMLISQALVDGMILLTKDKRIAQYDEPCIFPM